MDKKIEFECPLCGCEEYVKDYKTNYYVCNNCSLVFVNPQHMIRANIRKRMESKEFKNEILKFRKRIFIILKYFFISEGSM